MSSISPPRGAGARAHSPRQRTLPWSQARGPLPLLRALLLRSKVISPLGTTGFGKGASATQAEVMQARDYAALLPRLLGAKPQ